MQKRLDTFIKFHRKRLNDKQTVHSLVLIQWFVWYCMVLKNVKKGIVFGLKKKIVIVCLLVAFDHKIQGLVFYK